MQNADELNRYRKHYAKGEVNSILSCIGEGIVLSNTENEVIFVNRAAEELLGIREEDFLGRSIWGCHKDPGSVKLTIAESRHGAVQREATCAELGKTFKLNIGSIIGEDGQPKGSAMIIHDFTQEKNLQDELMASNRELSLRQEKLDFQLKMARDIQHALLTPDVECSHFSLIGEVFQASEVGGDFYLSANLTENLVFVTLGDVVGKGVPAALVMTLVVNHLPLSALQHSLPGKILEDLNDRLLDALGEELYSSVSLFAMTFDKVTGDMWYAGAAFEHPMLLRASGECELLRTDGFTLGTFPGASYTQRSGKLSKGDKLVLFTDGITDTRNGDADFLGHRAWYAIVEKHRSASGKELLEALIDEVRAFGGHAPQTDDIALLILEKH